MRSDKVRMTWSMYWFLRFFLEECISEHEMSPDPNIQKITSFLQSHCQGCATQLDLEEQGPDCLCHRCRALQPWVWN